MDTHSPLPILELSATALGSGRTETNRYTAYWICIFLNKNQKNDRLAILPNNRPYLTSIVDNKEKKNKEIKVKNEGERERESVRVCLLEWKGERTNKRERERRLMIILTETSSRCSCFVLICKKKRKKSAYTHPCVVFMLYKYVKTPTSIRDYTYVRSLQFHSRVR